MYSPGCTGCVLSPLLVLSSPQCWCCRCCRSLPLPSLSPHSCPIVVVSPVVSSKRPPAPAIPPASSGSQWGEWVLDHCFVGGFCRSHQPLAPSNPPCEQLLAAVEVGAGVRCWCSLSPFLCTHEPPYEQVLISVGRVCRSSRPPCPLAHLPDIVCTCKPPHEQWLVGMGRVQCWGPPSPARLRQVAPTMYPTSSCS